MDFGKTLLFYKKYPSDTLEQDFVWSHLVQPVGQETVHLEGPAPLHSAHISSQTLIYFY